MKAKSELSTGSNELQPTLTRGVERASGGAHEAIDSVTDAARPAVDKIAAGAHQAVDKVAGVATQAAETLGVTGDELKSAGDRLVDHARQYMNEHPVAALGLAVGAGYVLSKLLSPR